MGVKGTAPVKVGVVGLGQRGLQHLSSLVRLQREGQVRIAALCDAFPDNLTARKLQSHVPDLDPDGVLCTTEFAALCDPALCDALFIAIPPNLHKDEVLRGARAGLHLMVEKPMSLDLKQALVMEAEITRAGVIAACGFQQRFDPRHEAVRGYVKERPAVMATYAFHASLERHDAKHTDTARLGGPENRVWTANQAWSGTTVVEGGIHPLDLWRFWFGDVSWVQAAYVPRPAADVVDQADNPYAYSVQFGFAQGAIGNLVLSRLRRVDNLIADHRVFCTESQVEIGTDRVMAHHVNGDTPSPQTLWRGGASDGTYEFARNFVQAVATRNPDLVRSPFADSMNSLASVLAANVSHDLDGKRIRVSDWIAACRTRAPGT